MERRLIVEQFDPERPRPGGIDTCIRGLVRYCPPDIDLRIAGVDALGNKRLGEWRQYEIGGRVVQFMPVARVDPANLRRRFPHSVLVAFGLRKYRPSPDADIVQTHRVNMGATALGLYSRAGHVQFIHWDGEDEVVSGSESYFRRAVFAYRRLETYVVPRSVETVVFNKAGAERLQSISPRVRFSPTWYDPVEFFPAESEPPVKSRILWACRIDQGKNPSLAIDVLTALPPRYSLTVAGSGTLESAMRDRAQASPAAERIAFLGAVPKAEMGAVMREHDLMLMTSRSEGFSRSIVEGLASGLPVVTAAAAEPNGLVQNGVNGARVEGHATHKFVPAVEIASAISAKAARDSVSALSALRVVPDVLSLGGAK